MTVKRILNWKINSLNGERQEVHRSVDGLPAETIATLDATTTTYVDETDVAYEDRIDYTVSSIATIKGIEVRKTSPIISTKIPTDPSGMTTPYSFVNTSTTFNGTSTDPFAVTVKGVRHDAELVDGKYTLTNIPSVSGDIVTVEPVDYAVGYTAPITLTAQASEILNWSDFHWGDTAFGIKPAYNVLVKVPTTPPLTRNFTSLLQNAIIYIGNDVLNWDTSEVTNMKRLFQGCNKFVGEIGGWNVSKVTDFSNLFTYCHEFSVDISGWDTSSAITMEMMFLDTHKFAGNVGGWNVSKVTNMNNMIYNSWVFYGDLSQWCVALIPEMPTGFINNPSQLAGMPVWGTCPRGENAG